ncbi:hypothetical protein L226DRAFT_616343 [Lentinus tigrinus ALCF2SS1-7]|uniref:F-box domain-containing protein n=1 Tax=Lentinus tigrinus ALCF2SS1-6 TaxID=1328759 RepID=A0A5C2RU45_9APHY|nr:hypothetical protein L227DRAFT_310873 [Lentinus tigrinus ALCF2SS1-6]RPD70096.1 hypothetical protein L226DRAFT_616343 [Lentinus tigrinus ALCF2SS1-7]
MRPRNDVPTLFMELTDQIIDHLHADRAALQTCSLVCRSWQPAARFHLFNTMSACPEKCPFNELIAFLATTDDVAQHIMHFSLSGYRGISFADLESLLSSLTRLRTLTMDGLYISTSLSPYPVVQPEMVVPALAALNIKDCNVIDHGVDIFFRLLSYFGDIDTLRLSTWKNFSTYRGMEGLDELEGRIGYILPSHVRVTNLAFTSIPLHFLRQLCHPWSRPFWAFISGLSVEHRSISWDYVKQLGKVFAAPDTQLRRVSLMASQKLIVPDRGDHGTGILGLAALAAAFQDAQLPPVPDGPRDTTKEWKALRLEHCTTLDVFTVTLDHMDRDGHRRGREIFSTTVDLLTHVPSCVRQVRVKMVPHLDVNAIQFGLGETPRRKVLLEALDWQALDKVLSVPRFKDLTVTLEIVRSRGHSRKKCVEIVNNIRGELPLLFERGMLAVEVRDENE